MSPGVYPQERDLSVTVPAVGTSTGALVGYSKRGSLDVRLITNRQQFIEEYGVPDPDTSFFHHTALAFLERAGRLYCKRVVGSGCLYSGMNVVTDEGTAHRSFDEGQATKTSLYNDSEESTSDVLFSVYAKDPGAWGSNIRITITDVQKEKLNNSDEDYDPTEQYTFVVNVWYSDSDGNRNKLEAWKVSRQRKVDGYGRQLFIEERINPYSNYIYVVDNDVHAGTVMPLETPSITDPLTQQPVNDVWSAGTSLAGGADGAAVTASDINTGWDDFDNPNNIEVQILMDAGFGPGMSHEHIASIQQKITGIAEVRRDCIAILSMPQNEGNINTALSVPAMLDYRNVTQNINSSYAALYSPWCRVNDSYNDRIIIVPPSGYVAAHYALTDTVRDVWYAPAGFDRGTLNVLGLTKTFTHGERDILYSGGINCLQTFRGYGHVIYGQKTLQKKPSALDRVNVRRLLLMVEKAVVLSLRSFLFEPNNDLTRFTVKAVLDEYMTRLSAAGALQTEQDDGYLVVCDTQNNTPAVIDANELRVDLFIKPSRAAEFIALNMIVTKSGVSFQELISRGAIF